MAIKAVIFDMDGVISDTQKVHAEVEERLLKKYGINLGAKEITKRFAGVSDREMFRILFAEFNKECPDISQLLNEKWKKMIRMAKGRITEVRGTVHFIYRVSHRGFKLAVASGSRMIFIRKVLKELMLTHCFDAVVSTDEVKNGKPDPAVFLLAAKRLSVEPGECVVIEDGIGGMIAAKNAGMRCIALVREPIQGAAYPADVIVDDLRRISPRTFDVFHQRE